MTNSVPYSFEADMTDGRRISQGDKPLYVSEDATPREIEQLIMERLQDEGDCLCVRFARMSDYNFNN